MFNRTVLLVFALCFVYACGSVEPSASRGAKGTVSIEVTPYFESTGPQNNPFASCLSNYEQRFVGKFGKHYYASLASLATQNGINIRELGLADRDIVVLLRLNADNRRQSVKVAAEVVSMNSAGRILKRKKIRGDTIRFSSQSSPQQMCQELLGQIASSFNNQVMGSANELADDTIRLMVHKRF